jgi:hypothetical protein
MEQPRANTHLAAAELMKERTNAEGEIRKSANKPSFWLKEIYPGRKITNQNH